MAKLLSYMPYDMLIETDRGPYHSIITFHNKLAMFVMLLVTSVDKLILILGCPGLLYINMVERKFPVLTIGFSNLGLQMKP